MCINISFHSFIHSFFAQELKSQNQIFFTLFCVCVCVFLSISLFHFVSLHHSHTLRRLFYLILSPDFVSFRPHPHHLIIDFNFVSRSFSKFWMGNCMRWSSLFTRHINTSTTTTIIINITLREKERRQIDAIEREGQNQSRSV